MKGRWLHPSFGALRDTGTDRTAWIVAGFLLVGVLVPTLAVLWFMHAVATSESEGMRLKLAEAYRGHLRLLRARIDDEWQVRLDRVRQVLGRGDAAAFARVVLAGDADAIVVYGPDKEPVYPTLATSIPVEEPEPGPGWWRAMALEDAGQYDAAAAAFAAIAARESDGSAVARATQAQMRCLVRLGERGAVVRIVREHFLEGPASRGTDRQGRLIAADAQLLAIESMPPGEARQGAVTQLAALLNDYEGAPMPAHQRLFVMRRLLELAPGVRFPTLDAELLAASFLAGADPGALAFPVHDGTIDNGLAVALFRRETLMALAERVVVDTRSPSGVLFAISEGDVPAPGESIPLGDVLPEHHVAFLFVQAPADSPPRNVVGGSYTVPGSPDAADPVFRRRVALYAWIGYLAIALVGLTGFVLWRTFRRQQRMTQMRTDLLAAVSHELRTPLASMRLLIDSLAEDDEPDPERTRRYLAMVSGENARLTRLIEQFLTFSRMDRNRQRFDFAPVSAGEVVDSAVQALGTRPDLSTSALRVEVAPDLPLLHADRDALTTVLLNLLDNAYKYAPQDGRIVLRAFLENDRLAFEVEDNGIGIAARDQKRIFRRFYQVDQRLSRETGGCGLGLTIVHVLVRAHGGDVSVKSEPGRGSCFRVSLPAYVEWGAVA